MGGAAGGTGAQSGGAAVGTYHLTYLDEDTLVGRAAGSAGTFIFERDTSAAAGEEQGPEAAAAR